MVGGPQHAQVLRSVLVREDPLKVFALHLCEVLQCAVWVGVEPLTQWRFIPEIGIATNIFFELVHKIVRFVSRRCGNLECLIVIPFTHEVFLIEEFNDLCLLMLLHMQVLNLIL